MKQVKNVKMLTELKLFTFGIKETIHSFLQLQIFRKFLFVLNSYFGNLNRNKIIFSLTKINTNAITE